MRELAEMQAKYQAMHRKQFKPKKTGGCEKRTEGKQFIINQYETEEARRARRASRVDEAGPHADRSNCSGALAFGLSSLRVA